MGWNIQGYGERRSTVRGDVPASQNVLHPRPFEPSQIAHVQSRTPIMGVGCDRDHFPKGKTYAPSTTHCGVLMYPAVVAWLHAGPLPWLALLVPKPGILYAVVLLACGVVFVHRVTKVGIGQDQAALVISSRLEIENASGKHVRDHKLQ